MSNIDLIALQIKSGGGYVDDRILDHHKKYNTFKGQGQYRIGVCPAEGVYKQEMTSMWPHDRQRAPSLTNNPTIQNPPPPLTSSRSQNLNISVANVAAAETSTYLY